MSANDCGHEVMASPESSCCCDAKYLSSRALKRRAFVQSIRLCFDGDQAGLEKVDLSIVIATRSRVIVCARLKRGSFSMSCTVLYPSRWARWRYRVLPSPLIGYIGMKMQRITAMTDGMQRRGTQEV